MCQNEFLSYSMKKIQSFFKRRWKLLLVIALLLGGIGYWYTSSQAKNKEVVTTEKPARGELRKTLEVSGVVDAKEKAQLRFISGGKVVYVGAKEGEFVKKGQTIATIDRASLQKQLQQDLNEYKKERLDFDVDAEENRNADLDLRERKALEKNQLDLENSVLNVEIQSLSFSNTWVSAPFAGLLTKSPASVTGVQLLASDVFEVVNPSTLLFRAAVDEADISNVKIGQQATIVLDAYSEDEILTAVEYIAYTSSESSTGTVFVVELGLPAADDLSYFRLGMNGDVSIILEEKANALSVPLDATIERDDKMFVEVKNTDGTISEREIKTGLETNDRIEVIEGLSETDDVVIPS